MVLKMYTARWHISVCALLLCSIWLRPAVQQLSITAFSCWHKTLDHSIESCTHNSVHYKTALNYTWVCTSAELDNYVSWHLWDSLGEFTPIVCFLWYSWWVCKLWVLPYDLISFHKEKKKHVRMFSPLTGQMCKYRKKVLCPGLLENTYFHFTDSC